MSEERGKRRMAKRTLTGWGVFSLLCLGALNFGDLDAGQTQALVSLHSSVTFFSSALIFALMGLDATASQIIPAWRKDQ